MSDVSLGFWIFSNSLWYTLLTCMLTIKGTLRSVIPFRFHPISLTVVNFRCILLSMHFLFLLNLSKLVFFSPSCRIRFDTTRASADFFRFTLTSPSGLLWFIIRFSRCPHKTSPGYSQLVITRVISSHVTAGFLTRLRSVLDLYGNLVHSLPALYPIRRFGILRRASFSYNLTIATLLLANSLYGLSSPSFHPCRGHN